MKKLRKFFALLVAVVMVMGMTTMAFAQTVTLNFGKGSITVRNAAQGQDYELYKLFDATYSQDGISYKVPSGKTLEKNNAWFEVDAAGNVLAKEDADVSTGGFKNWAETFGTKVGDTVIAKDNTVKFDQIAYGYYYIKSGVGSTITVDSTNPDATVIDKNEITPVIPDEFKTVGDKTAQLGDDVNFEINFTATNYVTKDGATTQITKYTIADAPTALAIKQNSIKVTINNEDKTNDSNVSFSVNEDGQMTIELTWADSEGKTIYPYSVPVKVEYTATVTNAGADADGIKNSATIRYNNTSSTTIVDVNTYKVTIKKVDDKKKTLSGAEFEIRRGDQSGNPIVLVDLGRGEYRVATSDDTNTTTVIKAGTAVVKGLDGEDTYYLKETKAPEGYNILIEQVPVTFKSSTEGDDGETVISYADVTKEVENKAGTELPSTGGIGTTIFYVLGGILVLGAAVLLITRKRMNAEK